MKLLKLALVSAVSCTMLASYAVGQELQQPESLRPAAFTYDYYTQAGGEASPSDKPAAVVADSIGGCNSCGSCSSCCEPWTLFPNDNCWGLTFGGWLEVGYSYNGRGRTSNVPVGLGNLPVAFNYRHDQAVLNQFYGYLEIETDTGGCGWDLGGRVDLLFGEDFVFTDAVGLELHQDRNSKWNQGTDGIPVAGGVGFGRTGLAMPQAYIEVAYNDIKVKLGHFYTIIGYEVVTAPDNFFYSHAYTMLFGEPFTHTGVLASWDYSDRVVFYAGYHVGWDVLTQTGIGVDHGSFLGGITWESCDGRTTLAAMLTSGSDVNGLVETSPFSFSTRTMYSLVATYQISDRWQYVIQHDNGWQDSGNGAGNNAAWYGINQYLYYTLNDCWKFGGRFEWFNDQNGFAIPVPTGTGPPYLGSEFNEITLGLNWMPRANINVRPEIRWDWQRAHAIPFPVFNGGANSSQVLFGIDAIVTY